MNLNETVHFKFERFETERGYDYLVIGNPYEFDDHYEDFFMEYDYPSDYRTKPYNRTGLILDGTQQTDIWVNAESINSFDIYFFRLGLNLLTGILFQLCYDNKTLKTQRK